MVDKKQYLIMVKKGPNKFQRLIHHNNGWNLPWHYYVKINDIVAPSVHVTYPVDLVEYHATDAYFNKSEVNKLMNRVRQNFDIVTVVSVDQVASNLQKTV